MAILHRFIVNINCFDMIHIILEALSGLRGLVVKSADS